MMNSKKIERLLIPPIPHTRETALSGYVPLPRSLVGIGLPATALIIYACLLGRANLSKQSGWYDEKGHIYVSYTIPDLALDCGRGESSVRKHLKILEDEGLIRRTQPVANGPSRIYLYVPAQSVSRERSPQNYPQGNGVIHRVFPKMAENLGNWKK